MILYFIYFNFLDKKKYVNNDSPSFTDMCAITIQMAVQTKVIAPLLKSEPSYITSISYPTT